MAFVPYMVGGYAVDKMMGGDGTKGALLGAGGSFLPGMLASGAGAEATAAVATDAAASSFPSILGSMPTGGNAMLGSAGMSTIGANTPTGLMSTNMTNFGSVNPLTTGGISESISPFTQLGVDGGIQGVNTGLFGQEISKQGLDSALNPKLFNGALENTPLDLLGKGKDYIDTGYEDMTMMDKVQSGMMVDSAVNQPTPQLNIAPPPVDNRSQVPTAGKPLITQIQDIQTREPTEEELKYRAGLLR
jgi:hypothetical protein